MNGVLFQGHEDAIEAAKPIFAVRNMTIQDAVALISGAREAARQAYAPYSHFIVGSTGLFQNAAGVSKIYAGANQENAAFSPGQCGETVAVARARFEGFHLIRAIAVYGVLDSSVVAEARETSLKAWVSPCGRCRQVINETVADDCLVIMVRGDQEIMIVAFATLLPMAFGPKNLGADPMTYRP